MTTRIVQTDTLSEADLKAIKESMTVRIVRNRAFGFFLCRIPYAALQWIISNDLLERFFFRDGKYSNGAWC